MIFIIHQYKSKLQEEVVVRNFQITTQHDTIKGKLIKTG